MTRLVKKRKISLIDRSANRKSKIVVIKESTINQTSNIDFTAPSNKNIAEMLKIIMIELLGYEEQ